MVVDWAPLTATPADAQQLIPIPLGDHVSAIGTIAKTSEIY